MTAPKPKIVVHVPHAALVIPDEARADFLLPWPEVEAEAWTSADLWTDRLAREAWPEATILEARVSRIVVDVERFEDDTAEDMARRGRGVLYTDTHLGMPLRSQLGPAQRADLLARYYRPHWADLAAAARDAVLIDLHTYPAEPWPIEPTPDADRPEIDLGVDPDLTPEPWCRELEAHFRGAGFTVGINTPYAGVIDAGARAAVMLEIRRDVLGSPDRAGPWARVVRALSGMPIPGAPS